MKHILYLTLVIFFCSSSRAEEGNPESRSFFSYCVCSGDYFDTNLLLHVFGYENGKPVKIVDGTKVTGFQSSFDGNALSACNRALKEFGTCSGGGRIK